MEFKKQQNATSVKLLFSFILFLGIGVSSLVFVHGEKINDITVDLVEKQIPTFELFQRFHASLTEQERYLYEYYATEDEQLYTEGYLEARYRTQSHLNSLFEIFRQHPALIDTRDYLIQLKDISSAFQFNISSRQTDWDLAREQLVTISELRRSILRKTDALQAVAAESVTAAHADVTNQSTLVRTFVILYGLATLFIACIVARATISAISNAAKSQRLALFPTRNPNPIISLDAKNNITFANPASENMLLQLGQDNKNFNFLLAKTLEKEQKKILAGEQSSSRFEYAIDNITVVCELHWLADQKEWDLHLTDISAQKQAEKNLQYQAYHHPETGLGNRYELNEHLENSCRPGQNVSVAIMQLAEYNNLISSRGFAAAQMVINQLADSVQRLANNFTDSQLTVYHAGDDYFVFVCRGATAENRLASFIKEIDLLVASSVFYGHHQPKLNYGIAYYPSHGNSSEALLRNARTALDAIEPFQDNNFFVFDNSIGEQVYREQQMINDIRNAISNESFSLNFQPQVDINSNRLIGAEVLVRWRKENAWVSPGEFIPIAEKSGLIVSLGEWILRNSCKKAAQLASIGFDDLVIAVNISPRQFTRDDFLPMVQSILDETGLSPTQLELEITEGVIMHNEKDTIVTLNHLKEMGVKLAIDDFGTGYSSLSYLKQFPIDKLKIDQSFVRNMHQDKNDQSIVQTIIDLGKNLNLKLIAEGVEDKEHWQLLEKMGCHEIQGYFYSKPLAEQAFFEFIEDKLPRVSGLTN